MLVQNTEPESYLPPIYVVYVLSLDSHMLTVYHIFRKAFMYLSSEYLLSPEHSKQF